MHVRLGLEPPFVQLHLFHLYVLGIQLNPRLHLKAWRGRACGSTQHRIDCLRRSRRFKGLGELLASRHWGITRRHCVKKVRFTQWSDRSSSLEPKWRHFAQVNIADIFMLSSKLPSNKKNYIVSVEACPEWGQRELEQYLPQKTPMNRLESSPDEARPGTQQRKNEQKTGARKSGWHARLTLLPYLPNSLSKRTQKRSGKGGWQK